MTFNVAELPITWMTFILPKRITFNLYINILLNNFYNNLSELSTGSLLSLAELMIFKLSEISTE